MKSAALLCLLICAPLALAGQQKEVHPSNQQWLSYYGQFKLGDHWAIPADAGFRWRTGFEEKALYIVRAGLKRDLGSGASATAGMAHLGIYENDTLALKEYRPYQELLFEKRWRTASISQRFRVEERFFRPVGDGDKHFNFRFRINLSLGVPLMRLPALSPESAILLNLGNEIFLNAGREIVYNVFDQNRLILGLGLALNKDLSFQVNYNHQYGAINAPRAYRLDHVIWLSARHTVSRTSTRT